MEFARRPDSRSQTGSRPKNGYSLATKSDTPDILTFMDEGFFRHTHADWYQPNHWVDEIGGTAAIHRKNGKITAQLVIGADPLPAAWIRAAAFAYAGLSRQEVYDQFFALLDLARPKLLEDGVSHLYWMAHRQWTNRWMEDMGQTQVDTMVTYRKKSLALPKRPEMVEALEIRPVLPEDMRILAEIERDTYAPIWRHSQRALHRAWRHAISFDVAVWNQIVVGYQLSTSSDKAAAHLARLTVHPTYQKRGIGTHLQHHAFEEYRRRGHKQVTLNTQIGNTASQRLYERLGFVQTKHRWPIWEIDLNSSEETPSAIISL